ncbi:thiol reductant ABC exporter subunit CydC [Actinoplanes sp. NPDC051513]|uniref:thiol reductant ABC exporter subunit CydC n=1 Tax=Actinoplanes sp. NPDC051513 TaxID=3363908 RepID=UPI00378E09D4
MSRGPVDPRLLRHAGGGVVALALLGAAQAVSTLVVAVALTLLVADPRWWAPALLAAAYVARAVLSWAEQVVSVRTAARVTDSLRRRMLRVLPRRGPAWVADFGPGRLTAVLTSGLASLRPWFSAYLPSVVLGVTLPPLVIVVMAWVDLPSALIALATLPLIPLLGALIGWATAARARDRWQADARLAGHFLDVVQGLPTLRIFGRADRQTAVIAGLTDQHRSATHRVLRVAFLSSTALDLVGTLSVGLIAVEAGLRVAAGHLPLAPALLVILLAPEAYRPLREMAARYHAATDATAVISDVDEILDVPVVPAGVPVSPGADAGRCFPQPAGDLRVGVRAAGVHARYLGANAEALSLPALTVAPGEIVALRGPSGAGKTTALRVLAGLHPASAGTFTAPGPLYLPQRPALPHARVVADLFPPGTAETALATVGLARDLAPGTALGEHGTGVSAGQRHRLALAAVLAKAGAAPATLLLDEPTAHLDADTERLVIARLREAATAGSAILVVAHRPALLAAADRVVDLAAPAPAPAPVATAPVATATTATAHATAAATGATAHATAAAAASTAHATAAAAASTAHAMAAVTATAAASTAIGPAEAPAASARPTISAPLSRRRALSWPVAVALGSGSSLAGLLLTGAAAWLLVRAATLPPVLTLSAAVVLVRGSAVARPLLRYVERLVGHDVAFARLGARRSRVYAALIPRVPGPRLRRRGDLLTRVVDDVDARVDGLLRGRLPALTAAVTLTVATVAAVAVAPAVAIPLAAGLLVSAVIAPAVAARQAAREDATTATARAQLRDAMVETVDGIEELPAGSAVPQERSRALFRLESRAASAAGRATATAHLGWGIAATGTAWALTHFAALSPEWTAVVLLAVVALGETVLTLPDAAVARRRDAGAAARLADLTTSPVPATFPSSAVPAAPEPGCVASAATAQPGRAAPFSTGAIGAVAIRGLSAGWDHGREPVLRDFDLDLPAGSRVAVVGRSGSGKSTLGAVVARLLDPRAGTITAGGKDLLAFPEDQVRGRIMLVGDETGHVFASTVRENLRLARPEATDDELRAVLRRVRLDGWLATLSGGLDTWLGTGGTTMSGGQARRLATARALLAEPELLILDEPTEGLDVDLAEALMADLLDATSGRTVLLLTHRAEGLDRVDRVIDLQARPSATASVRTRIAVLTAYAEGGGRQIAQGDRTAAREALG